MCGYMWMNCAPLVDMIKSWQFLEILIVEVSLILMRLSALVAFDLPVASLQTVTFCAGASTYNTRDSLIAV